MQSRIEFMKVAPGAMKIMYGLEKYLAGCGLEPSLIDLIKLRASQINGCAYCIDMHTKDARARGKSQIPRPREWDGLVSVLSLKSVPQRRVQLQLHRTTHHGSPKASPGQLTSAPFLPRLAEQEALFIDHECFTPTWRSCWEPGHSVGKVPGGELSLSSEPECLSLQSDGSTHVQNVQAEGYPSADAVLSGVGTGVRRVRT